jgi:REP-associated tyrosine transposase
MPTATRASSGSPWWQGWSEGSGRDSVARMKRSEIRDKLSPMVRYRRNFVPGGTFFFTVTLADRRSSVLVDHVGLLRTAFRNTRECKPFAVAAIVILPDHLHAILTLPSGDSDFSGRWRSIKAAFTRGIIGTGAAVRRDDRGEYLLWQRRFWEHTIRDDQDFERCVNYVHFNPVKHRLVSVPGEWPFSSLHRYVRAGILPRDWGGDGSADDADFGERAE